MKITDGKIIFPEKIAARCNESPAWPSYPVVNQFRKQKTKCRVSSFADECFIAKN